MWLGHTVLEDSMSLFLKLSHRMDKTVNVFVLYKGTY